MLKNLSKPMQFALVLVLGVAAWLVIGPMLSPEPATRPAARKATKKPVKAKGGIEYTQEDLDARFAPLNGSFKNAFKPIVVKQPTTVGSGAAVNVVPPAFAGGEANWMYTGTAEIDGVLQALLENRTSGESMFLRVGDTWKGTLIQSISEDSIMLSASDGEEVTLHLPSDEEVPLTAGGFAPAQVTNPPLRGDISLGPLTAQPERGSRRSRWGGNDSNNAQDANNGN